MISTKSKDARETTRRLLLERQPEHFSKILFMCCVMCCVMGKDPKVATLD